MKIKKMTGFAAAIMMCSAFMAGCTSKTSAATKGNQAGDTIKIGVNMELSGAAGGYGQQEKNGIQLAVDEINAKGGVNVNGKKKKIKAIYRDNKSSTSTSASVATQLTTQDKVVATIGPATTNDGTAKFIRMSFEHISKVIIKEVLQQNLHMKRLKPNVQQF